MEHIETKPNIFIAGETYVPINWDFSDLAEKCHYYLQHPDEAERIIKNARRAYLNYFKNQEFVETIAKIIA
jgi:spore maturation protein CgeB